VRDAVTLTSRRLHIEVDGARMVTVGIYPVTASNRAGVASMPTLTGPVRRVLLPQHRDHFAGAQARLQVPTRRDLGLPGIPRPRPSSNRRR
jgi:hypothetical protein